MDINAQMDKAIFEDGFNISNDGGFKFYSCMYQEVPDASLPSGLRLVKVAQNTTMLGGTQKLAQLISGFDDSYSGITPITTMDSLMLHRPTQTPIAGAKSKIFGVMFGLDGAAGTVATVYPVQRNTKGFDMNKLIPLRRVHENDEMIGTLKTGYSVRNGLVLPDGQYYDWYLKRPTNITLKSMTKSGGIFDVSNPPNNYSGNEDVVTVLSITVDIGTEDFGEYFQLVEGDISRRRFNSVMICHGTEVTSSITDKEGTVHTMLDFKDIIVTNKYNILPRSLDKYNTGKYIINCYFR